MFIDNKKGVFMVVSISLLLIVGVLGYIYFDDWYNNYYKNYLVKDNLVNSVKSNSVEFLRLDEQFLQVRNLASSDIEYTSIRFSGQECDISGNISAFSYVKINVTSCGLTNVESMEDVAIFSGSGVFDSKLVLRSNPIPGFE